MSKKKLRLSEFEHVVVAWGENCAGPGWANHPIWVIIRDGADGKFRLDCIQPEDQTDTMITLFPYSALAAKEMKVAVEQVIQRKTNRRITHADR